VGPVSSEEEDIIPPGEQVAAQVSDPKKKGKKTEWILARISRYLRDKKKYEVEDEYDEDSGDEGSSKQGRKHYVLPRQSLIVLPKEGDPDYPEFPKDSRVLAVFPHTTTFYPAIVYKAPPSSRKGRGEYLLKFADDEEEGSSEPPPRKVPAPHVVAFPKMFSK
jgi:SAGA-associated factor 29